MGYTIGKNSGWGSDYTGTGYGGASGTAGAAGTAASSAAAGGGWSSWLTPENVQLFMQMFGANKGPQMSWQQQPMSPEEKALHDKRMGYIDNSPTRNYLMPQIDNILQGYNGMKWEGRPAMGGYRGTQGGETLGYRGARPPKLDWSQIAAAMDRPRPNPAAPAPWVPDAVATRQDSDGNFLGHPRDLPPPRFMDPNEGSGVRQSSANFFDMAGDRAFRQRQVERENEPERPAGGAIPPGQREPGTADPARNPSLQAAMNFLDKYEGPWEAAVAAAAAYFGGPVVAAAVRNITNRVGWDANGPYAGQQRGKG